MISGRRALELAPLGLAVVLLLAQGLSLGLCIQDDAFISLRYARHLASGEGLVFNPGERVEGITNLLWTVVSALPFALGWDPLVFLRVAGLASGALALAGVAALAREISASPARAPGAAAIVAAAIPALAAEAVMGLETLFFAGVAVWATAALLREWRNRRLPPWSGILLGIAILTRPEGGLVAVLLVGSDFLRGGWRERRSWVRAGIAAAVLVGLTTFRLAYFGDVVPNTFHAKVGGSPEMLLRGLRYALAFGLATAPLVLAAIAAGVALLRRRSPNRDAVGLVLLLALCFIAYVTYVGGDFKPSYRFFALPALLMSSLAGAGLALLADRVRRGRSLAALATLAIAVLLFFSGGSARGFAAERASQLPKHRAAGRWLAERLPPGSWLATGNAGAIPFESGLPTIDMFGLCDRVIARRDVPLGAGLPGHEKGDGRYVLDRRPRVILFQLARFSSGPVERNDVDGVAMSLSERELWSEPAFHTDYELVSANLGGFHFNFFERRKDER